MECKRGRDRRVDINLSERHKSNQHCCYRHIERPTDQERKADAQREVSLGFLDLQYAKNLFIL